MREHEFITERGPTPDIFGLTKIAHLNLSGEATSAIEAWESINWTGGALEHHIQANDAVAQEIEAVFAPIRARLPEKINLYRGIIVQRNNGLSHIYTGWQNALLQSWTSDRRVAEIFAGLRRGPKFVSTLYPEVHEDEINNAVEQYNNTGFLKFQGNYYIRDKQTPEHYNVYDKNRKYVTNGDNLASDLHYDDQMNRDRNKNKRAKSKVFEEEISRDRVVWITNTLNCKEFLVRR